MKRYAWLLIGLAIIIVAVASYWAFPEWQNADGGFLYLFGLVIMGVLAATRNLVAIGKDLGWWGKDGQETFEGAQFSTVNQVQTEGGAAISGNVEAGGDTVMRDKISVERKRALDAAIAKRIPVGVATELIMMVRRIDSDGLKAILQVEFEETGLGEEDVISKDFSVEFALGENEKLQPAHIVIVVDAPNFEPRLTRKNIEIPPDGDVEPITCLLRPLQPGNLIINISLYKPVQNTEDFFIASRVLRTRGERAIQKAKDVPYRLVSIPINVTVIEGNINTEGGDFIGRDKVIKAETGGVAISGDAGDSTIVTGEQHQITQIVNHYAQAHPETNKAKLEAQISGYLAWVAETFGKITLRGIEQSGRQVVELPLETIYVPLQAEYTAEKDDLLQQRIRDEEVAEHSQQVALNQILGLGARLIVTGGPGSGKTTVLQHIAWTLAHAIRGEQADTARQKLGLTPPLPLPIYVPLSLYASYRRDLPKEAPGQQKTLAAFIADYLLQNQTNLELDTVFFADLLRNEQRVLLLLDGLDEVPDEAERVIVRRDIEHLVSGKENLRVVVTSRTAAYQGRAVLGRGFQHVRVLPIHDEQIRAMVEQAYQAIYPQTRPQAQTKANDLLDGILRLETERRQRLGDDILPLVATPLMVRMLLIVHFNNRRLPDQRADLYQKAADAMLRPDYTLDETVSQEIERRVGGSLAINREMLQLLAFHMHQRGAEQGREISEDALCQILGDDPAYAPFVNDLVSQTRQRGTLLEERGGLYRFIHLSFQEFLTGRYLVEQLREQEKIAAFLEDGPVTDTWWREPVLLMIGYLDITSPRMAHKMLSRLAGLDEEAQQKVQQLPLETQLGVVELCAVAYQECQNQSPALKAELEKRLLDFFQPETQAPAVFPPTILASAADSLDRFGYLPPNLHSFVAIRTSHPAPGTAFHMGKYPVTNAQYQRFLEADDFASEAYWLDFPKFAEPAKNYARIGDWGAEGWQWLQKNWDENKKIFPREWHTPDFGIVRAGVPVVGISWYEANAYCRWLLTHWEELAEAEQNPGWNPDALRLPTETEWMAAAGGADPADRYPWDKAGEITQDETEILRRANVGESGIGRTTPVGMYPLGISPQGVWDLGGNVWEWQANHDDDSHNWLALRGGAWYLNSGSARLSERYDLNPRYRWYYGGFRLVAPPSG